MTLFLHDGHEHPGRVVDAAYVHVHHQVEVFIGDIVGGLLVNYIPLSQKIFVLNFSWIMLSVLG